MRLVFQYRAMAKPCFDRTAKRWQVPANRVSTAHWESLLQPMCRVVVNMLPAGQTLMATSGSLADRAATLPVLRACSMICGSSIRPRTNGPGWAVAISSCTQRTALLVSMALREFLPSATSPEADGFPAVGLIAAAIYGSLAVKATTPSVLVATSMTSGGLLLPPTNGPG